MVKSLPSDLAEAIVTGMNPTRAHELLGQSVVLNCFRDVGRAILTEVAGDAPVATPGIQLALAT
ncbi:hypothetical protein [Asticcacaulis sp.]|uniref:hypothetical protein n=1 Tax=Asticcacaulis sp. TaxID=1872648 RepID=UPI0026193FC5|nr:hypothetical protein [Asticcacaulis sp.]